MKEALKLALAFIEAEGWGDSEVVITAINEALAQPAQERNFCSRCGKRTADLTVIHTCTPPQEKNI
jgi:hypothetical protein